MSAASAAGFLLATGLAMTLAAPAYAQTAPNDDPLHLCYAAPADCTGFNGVSILKAGQPDSGDLSGWGVSISPSDATGTLWIALLIPDNEPESVLPTLSGAFGTTPVSVGAFIDEGSFGPSAKIGTLFGGTTPPEPVSAFQGATEAVDPGFTNADGYEVYLAKITGSGPSGTVSLVGSSGQINVLDNSFSFAGGQFSVNGVIGTDNGLAPGALVTAFLDEGSGNVVSTAQSSALLLDATPTAAVPEARTWVMMLAGFGLLGFAAMRKGKREARLAV
jgi:hypothetical protein